MSSLENLILPVTFNNWNTYSYSPRVNKVIGLSSNMGAMPTDPLSQLHPQYFYDSNSNPIELLDRCKEIDGSSDLESDLIKMLEDVKDIENEPILDSQFNFTLPHAFQYAQAKHISVRKFSIYYADSLWMGLLDYKTNTRFDPDVTNFTYKSNINDIDLLLNEHLDQHINLIGTDNYLLAIIDEIALRRNEQVNEGDACDYFLNKPFRMLILAAEHGINHVMENGLEIYKDQLYAGYVMERPSREEVPYIYPTRLFDNRYADKAAVSYETMCERIDIKPNWNLFEEWHYYNFKDCNTHEDNLVNTISRISTGYDFTIANWNYFQQAVFELGCKQYTDEASSSIFKKWINNRR